MTAGIFQHLAMALDPVELALAVDITPDPWQAKLLRSTAPKALLNCSRQTGKSMTTALKALHTGIFLAGSTVIVISPSQPQSTELFQKIHSAWKRLPDAPPAEQESATRLRLANGSRIISLPGSERTTRGYSGANLVLMDEASRCPDELLTAVRPMMATVSNAQFIALSTPFGKKGWFYEAWHHGEGWTRISVKATECPRISSEFLAQERATLGELMYKQEYELAFIDDGEQAFASELIEAAFVNDIRPFLEEVF